MKTRTLMAVALANVVLLSGGLAAHAAGVDLSYVGTFKAASGFYQSSIAFVPSGTNGDRTTAVNVPTLLTGGFGHSSNDPIKEWYIPSDASLAKVFADAPPAAVQVATVDGGTFVENTFQKPTGSTLLNGRMYGSSGANAFDPFLGELKLGYDSGAGGGYSSDWVPQTVSNSGAGTSHSASIGGIATKTDTADTLIWVSYSSGGERFAVNTSIKGAPTITPGEFSWTSTNEFFVDTGYTNPKNMPIVYGVIDGAGYYMLYDSTVGHAGAATLDLYDASVFNGGADASGGPTFSLNIDDAIGDGYDWNAATAVITDMAFDESTGRLYVTENNPNGGRAANQIPVTHVIQLSDSVVPEPSTVVLLVLGGLLVGGVRMRRRR